MPEEAAGWQGTIEKGVRSVFPGILEVAVSTGDGCFPPDDGLDRIVKGMKGIKADELLFEVEAGKLLIVKHDYGGLAAAVRYEGGASPADMSRLIQLMFARREFRAINKAAVPVVEVEALLKRWKYRVGLVFGKEFAVRLVDGAIKNSDKSSLTAEELERLRVAISSALGDCLPLDKVHK